MENKIHTTAGQPWYQPPPTPAPLTRYQPPPTPAHHQTAPAVLIDPHQLASLIAAAQNTHNLPTPAPHQTAMSGRAKDTALVITTTGAGIGIATTGIGAGAAGIGYGASLLAGASGGLMTAAIAIAIIAGAIPAALLALRHAFAPRHQEEHHTPTQPTPQVIQHITQQVTATGFLGKATGGDITNHQHQER